MAISRFPKEIEAAEKRHREAAIRGKAQWFAQIIRISHTPIEVPEKVRSFFTNADEFSRFERYLVHHGLYKRSDDTWAVKSK